KVGLDLTTFTEQLETLKLTVSADPGGFQSMAGPTHPATGVQMETQANAADPTVQDLVMTFSKTGGYAFAQAMKFRINTGNRRDLHVAGALTGFDSTHKIASAKSAATVLLAPGAEAALDLALAKDEDNVTPETTT